MTQNVNIAVKTESGQIKKISHGVIFQPETQFKGGSAVSYTHLDVYKRQECI